MEEQKIIIECVQSESEDLVNSLNRLMQQLNPKISPLTLNDLHQILTAKDTWLFVGKDQNTQSVVGTLTLISYKTPSGVRGYVEDVVVDREYRRRGIGEMLMQEGIEKAKGLQLEFIGLTSRPEREAANQLYQRLGFQKRDTNVYRLVFKSS